MAGLRVILDASQLSSSLEASASALPAALRRFFQRIAVLVERGASALAQGPQSAPPRAYPIPIRTGDLRRSLRSESNADYALVFSVSNHADAQQAGYQPYGNPRARPVPPRPFVFDAARQAPIEAELEDAMRRVFP